MQPVPMPQVPQVLESDRVVLADFDELTIEDLAERVRRLQAELNHTCEYGRALWELLGAVREYLVTSLPDQPDDNGVQTRTTTAPTGPHDDEGWRHWATIYAAVTSSLSGARGDSGFGSEEATVIAQHRRA